MGTILFLIFELSKLNHREHGEKIKYQSVIRNFNSPSVPSVVSYPIPSFHKFFNITLILNSRKYNGAWQGCQVKGVEKDPLKNGGGGSLKKDCQVFPELVG